MDERSWQKKYDQGVPFTIEYPPVPLFYFLEESAAQYPDATCSIFKGARITYKEMNQITNSLAAGLLDLGVKEG